MRSALFLLCLPLLSHAATARDVIERIKLATGATTPANTVDTIKAGDPETEVTGIATTFMDTLDVLQRANAAGKNLVISHEPTFYTHLDKTEAFENDPVYQAKAQFIREHHMVVWRFHDLWHLRRPDGILTGMVTALGWAQYQSAQNPSRFTIPETTLEQFATATRERLHIRNIRIVGDRTMKLSRVAFSPGAGGSARHIAALRDDNVDVLVIGEAPEWETVPYVQDAVSAGRHKALVILGHAASEEEGMNECARWLKTVLKGIPVEFIPATEPYWSPASRSLSDRMNAVVGEKVVPGAVTLVATGDGVRSVDAFGFADAAMTKPMPKDGIFWIASMTKPITAAAIMTLQDAGKLDVDDAVGKYIPEFAKFPTMTLRHLLTHTSGLAEMTDAEGAKARTLADIIEPITSKTLKFKPGAEWSYCQSGINTLGRVIEVVSNKSYERYLQDTFFTPLGMKDTAFYLTAAQMPRWIRPVKKQGDGFVETTISVMYGQQPTDRTHIAAPNAGIFTTAADYARFAQMLLNQGSLKGRKYLTPASVTMLSSVQTTPEMNVGFTPGMGYGFGVGVVKHAQGVTDMLHLGSFGHGGAYGTQAWIDPTSNLIYILMINRAGLEGGDANAARWAFQDASALH